MGSSQIAIYYRLIYLTNGAYVAILRYSYNNLAIAIFWINSSKNCSLTWAKKPKEISNVLTGLKSL